mmetsp:Transcript_124132/g.397004  ORF Transcript_124132/g.397004 Transcript_124132/m.397004 type:complete len:195 (-) Transcript_124132:104-688(-)
MAVDYGPSSKLLAALAGGGESGSSTTLIVYGDDDVMYGRDIVEQHVQAQLAASAAGRRVAFGSRKIAIGGGQRREELLEATGTISVFASVVPQTVFQISSLPAACRLSDDYWISHNLLSAGVELDALPRCVYDFHRGVWPESLCGASFHALLSVQHIDALSETVIGADGEVERRSGGDWREQLSRYSRCATTSL